MNKQLLAFNVMTAVKESYTESKISDSAFAAGLTIEFGEKVSTARVRQARAALGIANNVTDHAEELKTAKALLARWVAADIADPDALLKETEEFLK